MAMAYKNVTTLEVAKQMDVSRQAVYGWRKSKDLGVQRMSKLAAIVGIPLAELLEMAQD
jgi:transcriptional regulator with XRE-family HTH domain